MKCFEGKRTSEVAYAQVAAGLPLQMQPKQFAWSKLQGR